MKTTGTYLQKLREEKSLSQMTVATRLGYDTPQFISNMERNLSYVPATKFKKLVSILEADAKQLLLLIQSDMREQCELDIEEYRKRVGL